MLPWIQIEGEFLEVAAVGLAVELEIKKTQAAGMMAYLWKWCQGRKTGEVDGPKATQLVEAAAGWDGAPGQFANALTLVTVNLAEKKENGIRIKGTERYAAAQTKAEKDAKKKRENRTPTDDGAKTALNGAKNPRAEIKTALKRRADGAGVLRVDEDEELDEDKETTKEDLAGNPPAAAEQVSAADLIPPPRKKKAPEEFKLTGEPVLKAKKRSEGEQFFDWCAYTRSEQFPSSMLEKPPESAHLNAWYKNAVEKCPGGRPRLEDTWVAYLHDPWAKELKGGPALFRVFMSDEVWPTRVPGQNQAAPDPDLPKCELCGKQGSRGIIANWAEHDLCYPCAGRMERDQVNYAYSNPEAPREVGVWIDEQRKAAA